MIKVYQSLFCISFLFICYSAFTPSEGNSSILFLDKILHFGAFFLLIFLLDRSTTIPYIYHIVLIIFLVIFAVSIEIIQSFLPYRSAEMLDFVSDLSGILVYLYFAPKI